LISTYFVPFPFLTAPTSFALYSMSQYDVAEYIFGIDVTLLERSWVSVAFGALMIGASMVMDHIQKKKNAKLGSDPAPDFAFWGYLFGVLAFWGGLTVMYQQNLYDTQVFKLSYFLVNIVMMGGAVLLQRNVFAVFGALGSSYYVVDMLMNYDSTEGNSFIGMLFGSALIGVAYYQSQNNNPNQFVFWGYLFGVSIFWTGLSSLYYNVFQTVWFDFFYFGANLVLMCGTIYTQQLVFVVFGAVGVFWSASDLVYIFFWNSWYLPFILTGLGLIVIAVAIWFSKNEAKKKKSNVVEEIPLLIMQNEAYIVVNNA